MKYGTILPAEEVKVGQILKLNYTSYTSWGYHNRYNGDQVGGVNASPGQVAKGIVSKITEKAICVDIDEKYMWLPKSILTHDAEKMAVNEFEIARWFCYKNLGLDLRSKQIKN
jgi:hypothetical protein